MKRINSIALVLGTMYFTVSPVHAELFDRGGGLLYDNVTNLTWLQDANYAKTSGYDADGAMNWTSAITWASQLIYHDAVRNIDYSDWRLPSTAPIGKDWNYSFSANGSSDHGYNIASPNSELSYMYYVNLGLRGAYTQSGFFQPNFGVFGDGSVSDKGGNVGLVKNLMSSAYWSETIYAPNPDATWYFSAGSGTTGHIPNHDHFHSYAWAVRSGDVAHVPEPSTYALMLAGLVFTGFVHRKKGNISETNGLKPNV